MVLPPLRIEYDTELPAWIIEQKVADEGWFLRAIHPNLFQSIFNLLRIACTSGPVATQIISIDLGPIDPKSQLVATIVTELKRLTV